MTIFVLVLELVELFTNRLKFHSFVILIYIVSLRGAQYDRFESCILDISQPLSSLVLRFMAFKLLQGKPITD